MSEFYKKSKISLEMWEKVLNKALKIINCETLEYKIFEVGYTSKGLILEGLVKEFKNGNRSKNLYENLRRYTD